MTQAIRRVLDLEGRVVAEGVALHRNQLLELWRFMLLGRELDEAILRLQAEGKVGPYPSARGAEACAVGVAAAMKPSDWLFPSWRMAAAALVRDVDLKSLLDNALGNGRDPALGRQGPGSLGRREELLVPVSAPVGTQIVQAVGLAHAARLRGDAATAVALFGARAFESGDYHTALNFAGVLGAPVIFVAFGDESLAATGEGYGIEAVEVDGQDVLAIHAAVSEALDEARAGRGPKLIAAVAPEGDDGLLRLRRHLETSGALAPELAAEMEAEARHELRAALDDALRVAAPEASSLFADVTAKPAPILAWESEAIARFGAEYGGEDDPEAENILG